jgi:hypothetical protein
VDTDSLNIDTVGQQFSFPSVVVGSGKKGLEWIKIRIWAMLLRIRDVYSGSDFFIPDPQQRNNVF